MAGPRRPSLSLSVTAIPVEKLPGKKMISGANSRAARTAKAATAMREKRDRFRGFAGVNSWTSSLARDLSAPSESPQAIATCAPSAAHCAANRNEMRSTPPGWKSWTTTRIRNGAPSCFKGLASMSRTIQIRSNKTSMNVIAAKAHFRSSDRGPHKNGSLSGDRPTSARPR